jgi:hypothetical protein
MLIMSDVPERGMPETTVRNGLSIVVIAENTTGGTLVQIEPCVAIALSDWSLSA